MRNVLVVTSGNQMIVLWGENILPSLAVGMEFRGGKKEKKRTTQNNHEFFFITTFSIIDLKRNRV